MFGGGGIGSVRGRSAGFDEGAGAMSNESRLAAAEDLIGLMTNSAHPGFHTLAANSGAADPDTPSRAEKSLGILTSKVSPCIHRC